jgi:hypothetical protein
MEYSTRIDDLPENITMSSPSVSLGVSGNSNQYSPDQQQFAVNPTEGYKQLNVHPNPYGNGPPPIDQIGMPKQIHTNKPSNNPYISSTEQPPHLSHLPQHQLPSRDIPQDPTNFYHDEEITPNYIPAPKLTSEFVREQEERIRNQEKYTNVPKRVNNTWEEWLAEPEVRTSIIITVLFWIFQLPILNSLMFNRLSFLSVYGLDGNLNTRGLVIKSLLFGGTYYALAKLGEFIR